MKNIDLEFSINSFDWSQYDGHPNFFSNKVPKAIIRLLRPFEPIQANEIGDEIINAIGNNHQGFS